MNTACIWYFINQVQETVRASRASKITHTLSTCHCERFHICAVVKYSPGSQLEHSRSPYLRCASGGEPTESIRRGDAKPGWLDLVSLAQMLKHAAPYWCEGGTGRELVVASRRGLFQSQSSRPYSDFVLLLMWRRHEVPQHELISLA